ncbi:sensor histidine kinase [Agarilytica rhodophyticola]|uniref:sensor histidine kinase n=1 Tax=Agarilytica rhodophyticola TaxID=1737490 RepID=UPI000B34136E|nr:HAMP domain-containing sensor histidine kinase [Agarilytica rhodophyticola]
MKNNPQQSLPAKVGRIITGFSFFMVIFYSYMMLLSKDSGLRDATHSVLIHESQLFIKAYQKDPHAPLPESYSLKGFIGLESMPDNIAEFFPINARESWYQRKSGVYYQVSNHEYGDGHHHLYAQKLPNSDRELFIYYRLLISPDNRVDLWKSVKHISLLGLVLIIALLLILRSFIHRTLNPISSLSAWINTLSDQQKPAPLPKDIKQDEIGQLAHNLFHALERINLQNERERSFLRNASHELRTPIAIIRNTMDVLEHKGSQPEYQHILPLLQRIRRASDTMKAVTEAILWLAIDEYTTPEKSEVRLASLVNDIVEQNRNLLHDKVVEVDINIDSLSSINSQKALAYIAIDNLIRNSFQHCSKGKIKISAPSPLRLEISNSRFDINDVDNHGNKHIVDTGGFGLGLALVQKIADKKRWFFNFSLNDNLAVAYLEFS